jgi:hypothetical protein
MFDQANQGWEVLSHPIAVADSGESSRGLDSITGGSFNKTKKAVIAASYGEYRYADYNAACHQWTE